MPIRFRYDADRKLLIHIGVGLVSIEDIEVLREERRRAGVPPSVPHTLTDMRNAHFDFDIATLKDHEEGLPAEDYAGTRHAELVSEPKATAMLLIWKNWLPEGVLVEVFYTPEAAYVWLGVEPADGDLDS